jgi:hypothetical protein
MSMWCPGHHDEHLGILFGVIHRTHKDARSWFQELFLVFTLV